MGSEKIQKIMGDTLGFINQAKNAAVAEHDNEVYEEGRSRQFEIDIQSVICAFADLEVDKQQMMDLLHKWFDIDSITMAKRYIREAMQIEYPAARLKEYLRSIGETDVTAFIRKHQVLVRLNHEPELSKLSPEELKRRLEQTE